MARPDASASRQPRAPQAQFLDCRQRFLDARPGAPQDQDQATQVSPVCVVAGRANDGDDLLDLGRIGEITEQRLYIPDFLLISS